MKNGKSNIFFFAILLAIALVILFVILLISNNVKEKENKLITDASTPTEITVPISANTKALLFGETEEEKNNREDSDKSVLEKSINVLEIFSGGIISPVSKE